MAKRRGNGEGSIYKRGDGRWTAGYSLGQGRRRHLFGKSRQEVAGKLAEALRDQKKGLAPTSGQETLGHHLEFWLKSVRSSIRPRTYESYDLHVRRITPILGQVRLSSLKPEAIEAAYGELQRRGLSNRTVHHVHTVLHTALKKAVAMELIGRNPVEVASAPRPLTIEMKTLSEAEVQQLFAATSDDRLYSFWVLLVTTGLRLGEASGLQWSDLDLRTGRLTVRRSLQRQREHGLVFVEPKTKTSRRTVFLADGTVTALVALRERQLEERRLAGVLWQSQDLVFCRPGGQPLEPAATSHELHAALQRAGIRRVRVHDLRHTAATLLLAKGEHPKVVQEMLGHSSVSLTLDVYSHVAPALHQGAALKMNSLFVTSESGA